MAFKKKVVKAKKSVGVREEGTKVNSDELLKEIQNKFGEGEGPIAGRLS